MQRFPCLFLVCLISMPGLAGTLAAQVGGTGPDVIVGAIVGMQNYGSQGGIAAFSVGTTSCNIGTANLLWIANTNQHPVISQNLYRLSGDGKFTQIGQSWLKHAFFALTQNLCSTCNGQGGSVLGVGCADPYSSGLNGTQSPLGPRAEVNAATGFFIYPPQNTPPFSGIIARRLQVHETDLNPALNPGARYFVEAQYVTPDDAAAGNKNNNASYREVVVGGGPGNYTLSYVGGTERTKEAVVAWQDVDPDVGIQHIDIPGDGRITVAYRLFDLGNGLFRHSFAVHNLSSDLSVGSVSVSLSAGASVSTIGFHDVDYHSGEVFQPFGTDWAGTQTANGLVWQTAQGFAQNPNANAIRWGSSYSFWFDASEIGGDITLGMFKPGGPASMTFTPLYPATQWQQNGPNAHLDIDGLANSFSSGPIVAELPGGSANHSLNILSPLSGALWDVFVVAGPALPAFFTTPGGQNVNVDLSDPGLLPLNGLLANPWAGVPLQISFAAPNLDATLSAQMVILDPTALDGFDLSAAVEARIHHQATVLVEAVGSNSYIAGNVGSGYWKVHHSGLIPASITRVVLSFQGVNGRFFDTDQTNMGGFFNQGQTYRNGSAAATGLDFSVSSPFSGSGWIGTNAVAAASFKTIDFRFTGNLFNGQVFAFDADTDSGPGSQNGGSQAGLLVTVELSDGTVFNGTLQADPNDPNRSLVEFN